VANKVNVTTAARAPTAETTEVEYKSSEVTVVYKCLMFETLLVPVSEWKGSESNLRK
jgi:hypothetical protein